MRDAGVWSYGVVNLVHILGVSTLFGSILVLDLRLLGMFARTSRAGIATATLPLAIGGFLVAAVSGACMISTNASEYAGNPFLLIKFPAIGIALLNALALGLYRPWRNRERSEPTPRESAALALFGGISLAAWITAVAAARLIAYW